MDPDCTALLWVTARRWKQYGRGRWADYLLRYAAIGKPRTDRQHRIRAYPWGDVPEWPRRYNDRWRALREHVTAWARGDRRDPCGAWHWGGAMDPHPRGTVLAACTVSGFSSNRFYVRH